MTGGETRGKIRGKMIRDRTTNTASGGPVKRLMDIAIAAVLLVLVSPLLAFGAIGILLASPGPVFYRARRAGKDGGTFEMLKFRSMHVNVGGAAITAHRDPRIFAFGQLIRTLKIDELPQFLNVLRGDMSIVGPRPEDPAIVAEDYAPWMMETLAVAPGITSPGAVWYYGHGEDLITTDDPHGSYVARVLGPKLAIERAYLERATPLSDLRVMVLTFLAVMARAAGRRVEVAARDRAAAERWVPASAFPDAETTVP